MKKAISILLIAIVPMLICKSVSSQCTATGFTDGSSFGNNSSTGTVAFSNPGNARLSDGIYAIASTSALIAGTLSSEYLQVTGFNFSLPATALVCGIEVNVVKKAAGINILAYVEDNSVKLIKTGTITGSNEASSSPWPSSNTTIVYGSASSLWGTTWDYSQINASSFGVAFSANLTGVLGLVTSAEIDQIQVSVYYDNTPLALGLESFTAIKNINACFLSWVVDQQNDFIHFIVQRSTHLNDWLNIGEVAAQKNQQQYLYEDANLPVGDVYYRLQLMGGNGQASYSAVSLIASPADRDFRVFPNPALDAIQISYRSGIHRIRILDEYGRTIQFSTQDFTGGPIQLSIASLSAGYYFVQVDDDTFKLWKK